MNGLKDIDTLEVLKKTAIMKAATTCEMPSVHRSLVWDLCSSFLAQPLNITKYTNMKSVNGRITDMIKATGKITELLNEKHTQLICVDLRLTFAVFFVW